MSTSWVTKYGVRRVRVDLPTLEDALYAAEGLTSDPREQIEIAADLMQMPVEQAQAEAERIIQARVSRPRTVQPRRSSAPVVVERRTFRRKFA
ncbi:MAG: hypothetical protein K2X43_15980 [Hyphomonadaceae bacterium]|jgi:hypothetical protein|nr:hypothetical protein [Hyphomonadaceae bacterium]